MYYWQGSRTSSTLSISIFQTQITLCFYHEVKNVIRRAAFPNDLTLNAQRLQLIQPVQSIINFVAVVTETSTLFNFLITLERMILSLWQTQCAKVDFLRKRRYTEHEE